VQFVQIGLGTNTTFVQNLAGPWRDWTRTIDWLLEATSERRARRVRGVGVEPVGHLCRLHRSLAGALPHVEIVEAAIGDEDAEGAEVNVLDGEGVRHLAKAMQPGQRAQFERDLVFLRNMSTVGCTHPELAMHCEWVEQKFDVKLPFTVQRSDVWSYGRLVRTLNFAGCEVLMIDAEGCDTRILASVVEHCQAHPGEWPQLIQFETMGHCDKVGGGDTEWNTIKTLEEAGYTLIGHSGRDSHLAWGEALRREPRLSAWAGRWKCSRCGGRWQFPYVATLRGVACGECSHVRRLRHRR